MLIVNRLLSVLLIGTSLNSAQASSIDDLVIGETAQVIEVVDGDTVILDRTIDGANQVRMVGLQAPKLALGRKGFREWPLGPDSKYALEALALNQSVTMRFGGAKMDRHGRHLAHLFLNDGTWLQGRMLQRGMARVYSFPDNRALVNEMHALEQEARNANRGIWAHPFYALRAATPEALGRFTGTFQVIEGRVAETARVKGTTFLNFGENWRDDFTITLNNRAHRLFLKNAIDPLTLKGQILRVRGWLKKRNGPAINATHPEQIEIVTAN